MRRWFGILFFVLLAPLCAGSVRLVNNSPYDLRAVIRGSDGSFLGEVIIKAQNGSVWTDVYGQAGTYQAPNAQMNQSYYSQTPYTIMWYCMDGGSYGVCDTVATGATVLSLGCAGGRMCKPQKTEPYPQEPQGNYLHPAPEPSARATN